MPNVQIEKGDFVVRRPTLGGWNRILSALSDEQIQSVMDGFASIDAAPDDADQLATILKAIGGMKSTLDEFPLAIAAFCRECLRTEDGKFALEVSEAADALNDKDVDNVLTALSESGIMADVVARLKKRLSGLFPTT